MVFERYRQSTRKIYRPVYEGDDKSREKNRKGYKGRRREEIKLCPEGFNEKVAFEERLKGVRAGAWGNSIPSRENSNRKGSESAWGLRAPAKAFPVICKERHWWFEPERPIRRFLQYYKEEMTGPWARVVRVEGVRDSRILDLFQRQSPQNLLMMGCGSQREGKAREMTQRFACLLT